jgi:hypothetical protein
VIIVLVSVEIQIEETNVSRVTTTVQEALLPLPSVAVAMIFADPMDTAVTTPLLTVATLLLELVQFMSLFVVLSGQIVAERAVL